MIRAATPDDIPVVLDLFREGAAFARAPEQARAAPAHRTGGPYNG